MAVKKVVVKTASKVASTSTGLQVNLASALCYAPFVGWIAAVVLFIVEKNTSVKWNAIQSLLLRATLFVLGMAVPMTIVLIFLVIPLMIAGFVLDIYLTVMSYQGKTIRLPMLSDWSDKILAKV